MNNPYIKRLLLLFASAVLVTGLATACGGDDDDENGGNGGNGTNPTATTGPNDNGDDNGDVEEIEVSMQDNFFEPAEITIPVGQTVAIVAKNDGAAVHNMVVLDTDFRSDTIVNAGEESTFEVTFSEPGTYDFQCDFHLPDMVGTITVE